ncbi:MAG: phosphatase PAP2 family protein [Nocardioidaceae bacterium]|nr:phosphatase PAP2 family protein [Nocardioidaceae bacterium]MDQ3325351.1 phosphatase PAP2 family protein [Actinomycetota bacterium]
MFRRPYTMAIAVAALTGTVAVVMSLYTGLELRDPDGIAGPSYVRLPLILFLFFIADMLPRAIRRVNDVGQIWSSCRDVLYERWPWWRVRIALLGLSAFYLTYVSYRNLKNYVPSVRDERYDDWLQITDSILFLGADPAVLLHQVLGTGMAAHVLSAVYISYLMLVPISLAAALVWNRNISLGFWYVTALCINWSLGAASYYLLPSVGPRYMEGEYFSEVLPATGVSALQDSLWGSRLKVLIDPLDTNSIHGVAAFASLHVSVVFTAAYCAHRAGLHRMLRAALWAYLGLTVLSTVYFGWHYVVDDIAGVVIGWIAVTLGALATGNQALPGRHAARKPETIDASNTPEHQLT